MFIPIRKQICYLCRKFNPHPINMNDYNTNSSSPLSDLQRQQLLLRMEYEYEKEEFRKQTETMGIARKVKRGLCWYPVSTGTNL